MKNQLVIFILTLILSAQAKAQNAILSAADSFAASGAEIPDSELVEAAVEAEITENKDTGSILLQQVDTAGWAAYTRKISYDEEEEIWKAKNDSASTGIGSLFSLPEFLHMRNLKYFFLGLAVLLAAGIIYYMARQTRNAKTEELLNWDEIEDISEVREKDLLADLEKSLLAKDYKTAIRLRFLLLLKEMVSRGLITWRKEKTNTDYRYELAGHACSDIFNHAAFIFELVWYGERPADEQMYMQVKETQEEIFRQISALPQIEKGE